MLLRSTKNMNKKCECNCHLESLCEECFNSPDFYQRHNFLSAEEFLPSAEESGQERCDEVARENAEANL